MQPESSEGRSSRWEGERPSSPTTGKWDHERKTGEEGAGQGPGSSSWKLLSEPCPPHRISRHSDESQVMVWVRTNGLVGLCPASSPMQESQKDGFSIRKEFQTQRLLLLKTSDESKFFLKIEKVPDIMIILHHFLEIRVIVLEVFPEAECCRSSTQKTQSAFRYHLFPKVFLDPLTWESYPSMLP